MAERKYRSTAKKKTGTKKKTTAKNAAKGKNRKRTAAKKSVKGKRRSSRSRNSSPVYILIIVILLAVIAFLVNKLYFKGRITQKGSGHIVTSKDLKRENKKPADKKNAGENRRKISGRDKRTGLKEQNQIGAKIYFIRFNEKNEKMYLTPVKRNVKVKNKVKDAIEELIKGLSPADKRRGLLSAVPANLKLRSVRLRNRIAELDFNSSIERGAAGNILISRIDQIVYTATQFDDIDSVVIKINGRIKRTLGSDGLSIRGPLHRRE